MSDGTLSRRSLLRGVGAGSLVLGLRLDRGQVWAAPAAAKAFVPSVWIAIHPDDSVVITAHRSEMGQGARTCLPQIIADELGADWARVRIEQADGDDAFGSQNTDGSRSVRNLYEGMRDVGAAARLMLEAAAARRWTARPEDCTAAGHRVTHRPSKRSVRFGKLVAAAARLPVPSVGPEQRRPDSELRYIGKSVSMVDLEPITTGAAVYGQDVRLPGMKVAVIARSPVYGGTPEHWNARAALLVNGVEQVLEVPSAAPPSGMKALGGVAVVAGNTWAALAGRRALAVRWKPGPNASFDSRGFEKSLGQTTRSSQKLVREHGDVFAALAGAETMVTADYYAPLLAHAPMEPPNATARPTKDGGIEVWAPTQSPQGARNEIASALSVDPDRVTVHVTLLGGGFGRKSKHDFVVEAAWLARKLGAPVKVMWTREDDIRHDYYSSVSAQHLEAGVDGKGRTVAWLHRTAFPPIGGTFSAKRHASVGELGLGFLDNPYAIPNMRLENGPADVHVRIGWYRSVANIYHAFAVSSFVDELAHAAERDPLDHLLELLGPDRHVDLKSTGYSNYGSPIDRHPVDTARLRAVVERAARVAGWRRTQSPGLGMGIAVHRSFLAYVAAVVEVEVRRGRLRVPRVVMAVDAGRVINPDRVTSQMEGAAIMGLSNAIYGEITAREGRVEQSNFIDYRVLRMMEAPHVSVDIVPSTAPPAGVGEPGVPPIAPALCNAIFAATGVRIRRLPVRGHKLG